MSKTSPSSSQPENHGLTFDDLYARIASSTVLRNIWRAGFGPEYPEEASPFSFVTRTDLIWLSQELSLGFADRLIDLGCGCGGPGLFVAKQTGAAVVGVDTSAVAVAQAGALAARLGLGSRATYSQADATATTLPEHSFDGALCIDAVQMMPDPASLLTEAAHLLRPGSKLGLTTWCLSESWRGRAVIADYRPLLEARGFTVLSYDEPIGWKARQLAVYELIRNQRVALDADLGSDAAGLLLDEAENAPKVLMTSKRVRIVARLESGLKNQA